MKVFAVCLVLFVIACHTLAAPQKRIVAFDNDFLPGRTGGGGSTGTVSSWLNKLLGKDGNGKYDQRFISKILVWQLTAEYSPFF